MTTPYSSSTVSTAALSGTNSLDSLLSGYKWGSSTLGTGITLSASFPGYGSVWNANYGAGEPQIGFVPLNGIQQQAAQSAMQAWANVANISWQTVPDNASQVGDVRIAFSSEVDISSGGQAWGYTYEPNGSYPEVGDVWISATIEASGFSAGSYDYMALMHELGHALGLKHPFETPNTLPTAQDNWAYSIMAYTSVPSWGHLLASTPMLYDVAAIQYLYGANMNYHSGDDTYVFKPSQPVIEALWDAGGFNTLDFSAFAANQTLDLNPGGINNLAGGSGATVVEICYGVSIQEVVLGSGNNTVTAGPALRTVIGGSGTDVVIMKEGAYRFDQQTPATTLTLQHVANVASGNHYVTNIAPQDIASGLVHGEASGIAQLYLASFGRAPDADGLDYWLQQEYTGKTSLQQMTASFVSSSEYQARFPVSTDATALVTAVYKNVFSRTPDTGGLNYWVNALNSGAQTPQSLILNMLGSAQNSDLTLINDRDNVALYYTGKLAETGHSYDQSGITSLLQSVTSDAATVTSAHATIDNAMAGLVTLTGQPAASSTTA